MVISCRLPEPIFLAQLHELCSFVGFEKSQKVTLYT